MSQANQVFIEEIKKKKQTSKYVSTLIITVS